MPRRICHPWRKGNTGSETHECHDKPRILKDGFSAHIGRLACSGGLGVSEDYFSMRITHLPLKCCKFSCLGMVMKYAMAGDNDIYQHLQDIGVGYDFWAFER
jgi:hypothetical protein